VLIGRGSSRGDPENFRRGQRGFSVSQVGRPVGRSGGGRRKNRHHGSRHRALSMPTRRTVTAIRLIDLLDDERLKSKLQAIVEQKNTFSRRSTSGASRVATDVRAIPGVREQLRAVCHRHHPPAPYRWKAGKRILFEAPTRAARRGSRNVSLRHQLQLRHWFVCGHGLPGCAVNTRWALSRRIRRAWGGPSRRN